MGRSHSIFTIAIFNSWRRPFLSPPAKRSLPAFAMARWSLRGLVAAAAAAAAVVGTRSAAADEVHIDAATGQVDPATGRVVTPWPETDSPIGTGPVQRSPCLADSSAQPWQRELLDLHHTTYPETAGSGKQLVGLAMSAAPRPLGEHFHKALASLPPWLPVLFHSRLNVSLLADPQICAEVRATPKYPQLEDPSKLNQQVDYRATHVRDDIARTQWRSNIVLDIARTLSEASKLFHYVLCVATPPRVKLVVRCVCVCVSPARFVACLTARLTVVALFATSSVEGLIRRRRSRARSDWAGLRVLRAGAFCESASVTTTATTTTTTQQQQQQQVCTCLLATVRLAT
jgi:hypothetical protein